MLMSSQAGYTSVPSGPYLCTLVKASGLRPARRFWRVQWRERGQRRAKTWPDTPEGAFEALLWVGEQIRSLPVLIPPPEFRAAVFAAIAAIAGE